MKRHIHPKGNPNRSVFGILGKLLGADDGNYYVKTKDDSRNIGWDIYGVPVSTLPPTPTPTPTPTPSHTPAVTRTPTATPVATSTATITPSITITRSPTPTKTITPTPSVSWSV